MRSPLADRNERNVTGHFISKTTGKDESEKERREREFAGGKKEAKRREKNDELKLPRPCLSAQTSSESTEKRRAREV